MRVCILGAGLSALTLAKALVNQKIYVDLIFSKKLQEKNKSRTIGISKSNVEYFNNNIANIKKIIWKLKKIDIFSDNYKKEKILEFEDRSNQLFSVVKNYKLYECLEKNLKKNKYFKKVIFKKKFNFNEEYNIIFNTAWWRTFWWTNVFATWWRTYQFT